MATKACSDCDYWAKSDSTGLRGQCRFMPPRLPTHQGNSQVFPETKPTDWCGAFTLNQKMANELIGNLAEKMNLPDFAGKWHNIEDPPIQPRPKDISFRPFYSALYAPYGVPEYELSPEERADPYKAVVKSYFGK